MFSGVGGDVMHGDWLANCSTDANPCRRAQQDWPNGPQRVVSYTRKTFIV